MRMVGFNAKRWLFDITSSALFASSQADDVRNRIVEMTADNDSDVEREASWLVISCDCILNKFIFNRYTKIIGGYHKINMSQIIHLYLVEL